MDCPYRETVLKIFLKWLPGTDYSALRASPLAGARGRPKGRSPSPLRGAVVEPGLSYVGGSKLRRRVGLTGRPESKFFVKLAPRDGFEPPTNGLTGDSLQRWALHINTLQGSRGPIAVVGRMNNPQDSYEVATLKAVHVVHSPSPEVARLLQKAGPSLGALVERGCGPTCTASIGRQPAKSGTSSHWNPRQ